MQLTDEQKKTIAEETKARAIEDARQNHHGRAALSLVVTVALTPLWAVIGVCIGAQMAFGMVQEELAKREVYAGWSRRYEKVVKGLEDES